MHYNIGKLLVGDNSMQLPFFLFPLLPPFITPPLPSLNKSAEKHTFLYNFFVYQYFLTKFGHKNIYPSNLGICRGFMEWLPDSGVIPEYKWPLKLTILEKVNF